MQSAAYIYADVRYLLVLMGLSRDSIQLLWLASACCTVSVFCQSAAMASNSMCAGMHMAAVQNCKQACCSESRPLLQDASTDCCYRISQEGLPLVLPHVTKQLLRLTPSDFMRLLTERNCALPDDAKRGLSHPPASSAPAAPASASTPAEMTAEVPAASPSSGQNFKGTRTLINNLAL